MDQGSRATPQILQKVISKTWYFTFCKEPEWKPTLPLPPHSPSTYSTSRSNPCAAPDQLAHYWREARTLTSFLRFLNASLSLRMTFLYIALLHHIQIFCRVNSDTEPSSEIINEFHSQTVSPAEELVAPLETPRTGLSV